MTTTNWRSCLALLFAGTLALTGCSSSSNGKDGAPGKDGTPGQDGSGSNTPPGVTAGINVAVTGVSQDVSGIQVRFTLKDDRGYPIDITGRYSVNTPIFPKFSLSYLSKDDKGQELPLTVLTASGKIATPTATSPTAYDTSGKNYRGAATAPQGTLVENGSGNGDYTYTFPAADISSTGDGALYKGVTYDASKLSSTHVVWIEVTRQTDIDNPSNPLTFTAKNEPYYYVPATGAVSDERREIASTAGCTNCHAGFKPEANPSATGFHGNARVDAAYCVVCHNPARTSNPAANAMVFVHRIHRAEELQPAHVFDGIADVTYPQDIRNCAACHAGAAQGDQWKTRPTMAACGSCHDTTDFSGATPPPTGMVAHSGGAQTTDEHCAECHAPGAQWATDAMHLPVALPDPGNALASNINTTDTAHTKGVQLSLTTLSTTSCTASAPCDCTKSACYDGNANTNAAYLAAAGAVPPNAASFSYDVQSVTLDSSNHPQIVFKLKKTVAGATTDVTFNSCVPADGTGTATPGSPLIAGGQFVGGPSVYFVWAVPQDGIAKPADYNASASAYLPTVCNGSIKGGVKTATITGPDGSGYYTVTLTGTTVASTATMLTGGVGFTYNVLSAPPLTQIDLPAYPYDATARTGGLIVPAPDVYVTATGGTARRKIVDNEKCKSCHVALGANPTFHAGQRNDGPSCAWCHNPNKVSGGWAISSKDLIHSLHAARVRSVPFVYQADFADITYPSRLNNCESCHFAGTYDFTLNAAAVPNLLWSTEAVKSTSTPTSPYVTSMSSLGTGFTTSGPKTTTTQTTGTITQGPTVIGGATQGTTACSTSAPCDCTVTACTVTTSLCTEGNCNAQDAALVTSPIVAACVRCHDGNDDVGHMKAFGGSFYEAYGTAKAKMTVQTEQCLICHGQGTIADISQVHMSK